MKRVAVEGIEEFVGRYNPFVFRDKDGSLMYFKDYESLYLEALERIFAAGPYFVDAVLFCKDNMGMEFNDAKQFVRGWNSFTKKKDYYLFDWRSTEGQKQAKLDCKEFLMGLHSLSETRLNTSMYLSAFQKFCDGISKRLDKEEGRKNYAI